MRRASQQMAAPQAEDSASPPASPAEATRSDASILLPNTPGHQQLGKLSLANQSQSKQPSLPHATPEPQPQIAVKCLDDTPGLADQQAAGLPEDQKTASKESICTHPMQGATAGSIMTPQTKQLAAGYIPRRQQPEPSYLDRKVRALQVGYMCSD